MNILIAGGTGYIGTNLINKLLSEKHNITILTRNISHAQSGFIDNKVKLINWSQLNDKSKITNPDCIINLSGESIGDGRWTKARKKKILDSRINSTATLVNAIKNKIIEPKVFINASAVGYYGPNDNDLLTESSSTGNDFLADVCRQWEAEAMKAADYGVRVVCIRTGIVLGEEGALKRMLMPFRFFVGGAIGNGKQWMSWIHINDLVDVYIKAISDNNLENAVNATAPNPVTMKVFAKTLGQVLHRPSFFDLPAFVLKTILGEMSDIVLKGQKVIPDKLEKSSFHFSFPTLCDALKDILKK